MDWWPVVLMIGLGLLALAFGWAMRVSDWASPACCREETHLAFDVRVSVGVQLGDPVYVYLRCRQHPGIVFMIDAIELYNLELASNTEWSPLAHALGGTQ